ncbi:hypothetical protein T484DRAFT_1836831 [Baffinella frigidus]|nr:hypothetical protein T484DRAFT_1836831 [Cryptophyta sp. CCMP2293]
MFSVVFASLEADYAFGEMFSAVFACLEAEWTRRNASYFEFQQDPTVGDTVGEMFAAVFASLEAEWTRRNASYFEFQQVSESVRANLLAVLSKSDAPTSIADLRARILA